MLWESETDLIVAFLTVPLFATSMSLRNMCSWRQDEFVSLSVLFRSITSLTTFVQPVLIGIACIGWVTNHFTSTKFINQSDFCAAVGYVSAQLTVMHEIMLTLPSNSAFAVGIVANVWARVGLLTGNNAFVIMVCGIPLAQSSHSHVDLGRLLGSYSNCHRVLAPVVSSAGYLIHLQILHPTPPAISLVSKHLCNSFPWRSG